MCEYRKRAYDYHYQASDPCLQGHLAVESFTIAFFDSEPYRPVVINHGRGADLRWILTQARKRLDDYCRGFAVFSDLTDPTMDADLKRSTYDHYWDLWLLLGRRIVTL